MVWMQAGTIIRGTTKGFAGAALAGNEKGQEAVQAYGKWTQVSIGSVARGTPGREEVCEGIDWRWLHGVFVVQLGGMLM